MRGVSGAAKRLFRAVALGMALSALAASLHAQTTPLRELEPITTRQPENGATNVGKDGVAGAKVVAEFGAVSEGQYAAWENDAARAEDVLADAASTDVTLDRIRAQLVEWRSAFQAAQSTNSARIATLRQQISALGPATAEGETESEDVASRRITLNEQLARLQAPGLAAEEAGSRADGLIREIDRTLRERQTDALLTWLPLPINPANWPDAWRALSGNVVAVWQEAALNWDKPRGRDELNSNLPAIGLLLLVALGLIWRGRRTVERWVPHLSARTGARGMRVASLMLSLGQIVIPMIGVIALSNALRLTGLPGIVGTSVVEALPGMGFLVLASYWLGGQLFPRDGSFEAMALPSQARAEGRFLSVLYGSILGLETLRTALIDERGLSDAALSVLAFPALLVTGLLLVRLGRLFRLHVQTAVDSPEDGGFRDRVIGLVGRGTLIIGVVGPVLAAVGYITAAGALIFPAATSLGIIGILFLLQVFVTDVYAVITRSKEGAKQALVPVLIGFVLVLASIPLFALIWGARPADLTEVWTRVSEGFQLGDTRISPTNFLVFVAVFAFGYTATRLFQGALKGTVLPRTKMDQGARNAIVSGVGYLGIFLAALIAINSAGIDLSGLAIVAGALSVGIGFGLQNIVSNFVSGIILLIERPVSEGDWIEVGGVQGTVKSISVRSTRIQTFDRTDVIVPNTDLIAGQVTNWTRFSLSGRLIVPIGVAYGTDTRLVERVLREIAEAQPMAILNPPPAITFMGFGADSMDFEIRVILRDVNFSLPVRTEINHQIVARFAEEGIEIPFSQSEITLRNAPDIADMLRLATAATPIAPGSVAPSSSASARRTPRKAREQGQGTVVPDPAQRDDAQTQTGGRDAGAAGDDPDERG
jgi:potassium efflux system protein